MPVSHPNRVHAEQDGQKERVRSQSSLRSGDVTVAALRSSAIHGAIGAGSLAFGLFLRRLEPSGTLEDAAMLAGLLITSAVVLFSIGALTDVWVSFARLRRYLRTNPWSAEKAQTSFPILFGKMPFVTRLLDRSS